MKKVMLFTILTLSTMCFVHAAKTPAMVGSLDLDFKAAAQRHTLIPLTLHKLLFGNPQVIQLNGALAWVRNNIGDCKRKYETFYKSEVALNSVMSCLYEQLRNLEIILQRMADNPAPVSKVSFEVASQYATRLLNEWLFACAIYIQAEQTRQALFKNESGNGYGYQTWLEKEPVINVWLAQFFGYQPHACWAKATFDSLKKLAGTPANAATAASFTA